MNLVSRVIQKPDIVGIDWENPITKGLQLALPMTTPGRVQPNLATRGDETKHNVIGSSAYFGGGVAYPADTFHAWHNDFYDGYAMLIWHAGFTWDGDWQGVFAISDSTISWQRYSSSAYFKIYHNGSGSNWNDLTLTKFADPAVCMLNWGRSGSQMDFWKDGELDLEKDFSSAPKTDSTISSWHCGRGNSPVYHALMFNRQMYAADFESLCDDPWQVYQKLTSRLVIAAVVVSGGVEHEIAGSISALSSVSGSLSVVQELAGSVTSEAGVFGALSTTKTISSQVSSKAVVSGKLCVTKGIVGSVASQSTIVGNIKRSRGIIGGIEAQSSLATTGLSCLRKIVGDVSVQSLVVGSIKRSCTLSGTVAAQSIASASLHVLRKIVGSVASQSDVSGDLSIEGTTELVGSIAALSSISGTVHVLRKIVGSIEAQSDVIGDLSIEGSVTLAGSIAALSSMSGTVHVTWGLGGSIDGSSDITGQILRIRSVAGSAQAQSELLGFFRRISKLAGAITVQSNLSGSLTRGSVVTVAGSIEGVSELLGALKLTWGFSGEIGGISGLTGAVSCVRGLGGEIGANTDLSASLTDGFVALQGSIQAIATLLGNLRVLGKVTIQAGTIRPSNVLAEYLIGQGLFTKPTSSLDWPLFTRNLPDLDVLPDSAACLYDTTGVVDSRGMRFTQFERHGLQLRIRAVSKTIASEKIASVIDVLKIIASAGVSVGVRVFLIQNIGRTTTVVPLGRDTQSREHLVTNYLMSYSEL